LKLDVLIAYPYVNTDLLPVLREYGAHVNWLLDSGAFTAWKSGKPIALDDYCRFLDQLPVIPWRHFTLDVVNNPAATTRNYETMLKRGYQPIPVFTKGQDFSVLDGYYQNSDLVGCGGLAEKYGARAERYLVNVIDYIAGRPVHLLGYTYLPWLKRFRPYSCDSSSWLQSRRFGRVNIYLGCGRMGFIRRCQIETRPPQREMDAIRAYGFNPYHLKQAASWNGRNSLIHAITTASWVYLCRDLQRHLGVRLFLAASSRDDLSVLIDEFMYQTQGVRTGLRRWCWQRAAA
jgi:hypothetical protein